MDRQDKTQLHCCSTGFATSFTMVYTLPKGWRSRGGIHIRTTNCNRSHINTPNCLHPGRIRWILGHPRGRHQATRAGASVRRRRPAIRGRRVRRRPPPAAAIPPRGELQPEPLRRAHRQHDPDRPRAVRVVPAHSTRPRRSRDSSAAARSPGRPPSPRPARGEVGVAVAARPGPEGPGRRRSGPMAHPAGADGSGEGVAGDADGRGPQHRRASSSGPRRPVEVSGGADRGGPLRAWSARAHFAST